MGLHEILSNRPCIWILKLLYDQETSDKKIYTINLSKLSQKTGLKEKTERFVLILSGNGLIHLDEVENDKVICLTQKGKDFFKQFDKLKGVLESKQKTEQKKLAKVEYALTDAEKKILVMTHKLEREVGQNVPMKNIVQELYPYEDYSKRSSIIYKNVDKLEKLNLIAKTKKGRVSYVYLTDSGKRTIKDQIIESLVQQFN